MACARKYRAFSNVSRAIHLAMVPDRSVSGSFFAHVVVHYPSRLNDMHIIPSLTLLCDWTSRKAAAVPHPALHKSKLSKGNGPLIRSSFSCVSLLHNQAMIYSYARVSTDGQSEAEQVRQLRATGAVKVFREVRAEPRPTCRSFAACWPGSTPATW